MAFSSRREAFGTCPGARQQQPPRDLTKRSAGFDIARIKSTSRAARPRAAGAEDDCDGGQWDHGPPERQLKESRRRAASRKKRHSRKPQNRTGIRFAVTTPPPGVVVSFSQACAAEGERSRKRNALHRARHESNYLASRVECHCLRYTLTAMSRKTKARRRARKARPKHVLVPEPTGPWGAGPELTPQERARVLSRYSDMRCRGFRFGFVFPFGWVKARNPEELEEAVRVKLLEESKGKPQN